MKNRFYTNNTFDSSTAGEFEARVFSEDYEDSIYLNLETSGWAGFDSVSFYAVQNLKLTYAQAREIVGVLQEALDSHDEAVALAQFDSQRDSDV